MTAAAERRHRRFRNSWLETIGLSVQLMKLYLPVRPNLFSK